MRILIVEDDLMSRNMLYEMMSKYGECYAVENGKEAVVAFDNALSNNKKFHLIFLDIMMPEMDGKLTLKALRKIEDRHGLGGLERTKIVMTTAVDDPKTIMKTFTDQTDGYIVKPINKKKILEQLKYLDLIES